MRVLSLDFDGVTHAFGCAIDRRFSQMHLIHRILEQDSKIRITVHSSWRSQHEDDALKSLLFKDRPKLADRFIGATNRDLLGRWESLENFAEAYEARLDGSICVLDDEPKMFPSHVSDGQDSRFHFVHCPTNQGLREFTPAWEKLRGWLFGPRGKERVMTGL